MDLRPSPRGRMRKGVPALRGLLKRPRRLIAAAAAVVVLAGAGTWATAAVGSEGTRSVRVSDRIMTFDGVRLDTSFFAPADAGRHPAVLLGHGFGGSKDDMRTQAEDLARHGYAVLTW